MEYTRPGLYHCNLCNDPFNEGNKAQHLCSTRHRCNVSLFVKTREFMEFYVSRNNCLTFVFQLSAFLDEKYCEILINKK